MGWQRCDGTDDEGRHEGYVTAVIRTPDGYTWRELTMANGDTCVPLDEHGHPVHVELQVACTCGWRSERFAAPLGVDYMPHTVLVDRYTDDRAYLIWADEHMDRRFARMTLISRTTEVADMMLAVS